MRFADNSTSREFNGHSKFEGLLFQIACWLTEVFIFGYTDLICKIPMSGVYRFLAFVTTFVSSNGKVFSPDERNI